MTPQHEDSELRPPADNKPLSVNRRKRYRETPEYHEMMRRLVRAYARRVSAGDIDAIAGMCELSDELDHATRAAVHGLLAKGYSWTDVGRALGVSRQGARQRWVVKP